MEIEPGCGKWAARIIWAARMKWALKETWPLKKMYISCTNPSCHNWFPDFLLVRQNSFATAYPMNYQNKLVWQFGSVHKINIYLEATSPFKEKINGFFFHESVILFLFDFKKSSYLSEKDSHFCLAYGKVY